MPPDMRQNAGSGRYTAYGSLPEPWFKYKKMKLICLIMGRCCGTTGSLCLYESVNSQIYIEMNFDELKDSIIEMLAGNRVKINTATFANDMTTFQNRDDVLTLLIHLGYLAYNSETQEAFIPNYEVSKEFANALQGAGWNKPAH